MSLNLDLPEPEWIGLLRAERALGKSISQIAREVGMARPSVSMLIAGTYPAQSLDLVTRKHAGAVFARYRRQVLCPHLRRGISADECTRLASAPMAASNPEKLRQWGACKGCEMNPLHRSKEGADG
jgi:hypothetical protein